MSGLERLALAAMLALVYCGFCLWCLRHHLRQGRSNTSHNGTLVAYASQTGTAMALARQTADAFSGDVTLLSLNQVDEKVLARAHRGLIIASTYGNGEPPDNAARFDNQVLRRGKADLGHLDFAVLALGDASYPDFCAFGRRLQQCLSARGATALCDPVELDAAHGEVSQEHLYDWHALLRKLGGQPDVTASGIDIATGRPWEQWVLDQRTLLNPGSPGAPLFHLQFKALPGETRYWEAGDIVEVAPVAELAARKYSIASIPGDGTLDLVVRQQRDESGRLGLASGWLTEGIRRGDFVPLRLCSNPLFHAPETPVPLLLIGNGSGIAGLRAHLRNSRLQQAGMAHWLIYGERQPGADTVFATELEAWLADGTLARLDRAFSRCPVDPLYVQDCLYRHERLVETWVSRGATVMVCGSREGMAQGVDKALEDILGRDVLDELDAAERYRKDIY